MTGVRPLTLFLTGDLMPGRGVDQVLPHSCPPHLYERYVDSALGYLELAEAANGPIPRPVPPNYVWGDALAVLEEVRPDVRVVNLETSVTTSETAMPKGINYRMHPGNAPVLTVAGIDCCVLANNHVLDWGESGLLQTLETLEGAGLALAGAGRDLSDARAPAALEVDGGGRVVVFGMGVGDSGIPESWAARPDRPGVHRLPDLSDETVDTVGRLVDDTKRPGDLAVASVHWGRNWGFEVPRAHRRFAHGLIQRAGIDLVHGHSSHHPKAMEVHDGHLILYGCGDFLDDYEGITGYEEFREDLVLMYFPTLDRATGRLLRLDMRPLQIRSFRLNHPPAGDRAWLGAILDRECGRFGLGVREEAGALVLQGAPIPEPD